MYRCHIHIHIYIRFRDSNGATRDGGFCGGGCQRGVARTTHVPQQLQQPQGEIEAGDIAAAGRNRGRRRRRRRRWEQEEGGEGGGGGGGGGRGGARVSIHTHVLVVVVGKRLGLRDQSHRMMAISLIIITSS